MIDYKNFKSEVNKVSPRKYEFKLYYGDKLIKSGVVIGEMNALNAIRKGEQDYLRWGDK